MKLLLYALLTTCISSACSINSQKENPKKENLQQKFIPVLTGDWVLTEYMDQIEKTRSPLKSADKLEEIVEMTIDESGNADSVVVGASWGNHEGYSFTVYFVTGQNQTSLKTDLIDYDDRTNFYEIGYETIQNEIFLFLYHYDKTRKLIDKKQFSKVVYQVKMEENDLSSGLQYTVNEKLFTGNYTWTDDKNTQIQVRFNSDGSLTGHPDFKSFYVITDFMAEPADVDEICFDMQTHNQNCFAFHLKENTIFIYSTKGIIEKGETLKIDKLKYKLIKN